MKNYIIILIVFNFELSSCSLRDNKISNTGDSTKIQINEISKPSMDNLELDSKNRRIIKTFSQFSDMSNEIEFPFIIDQNRISINRSLDHDENTLVLDNKLIMNNIYKEMFERNLRDEYSDKLNLIKYFRVDDNYSLANDDSYSFHPIGWFSASQYGINTFLSYIYYYRVESYEGDASFILMANVDTYTNELLNCVVLGISLGGPVGSPYRVELNSKVERGEGNTAYVKQDYSVDSLGVPEYFAYPDEPGAPIVHNYISLQKKDFFYMVFKDSAYLIEEEKK